MDTPSPYAAIDQVIEDWCFEHRLKLWTEFGGEQRRFTYVTGGPQECFQISVEPPVAERVVVNVWSIETIDDSDLHEHWLVGVAELKSALDSAWKQVEVWNGRIKGPATWFPPKSWGESA